MTERDIKLLWGRSGNRCAICRVELSHDKKLSSEKYPLGEQAHIVGEKEFAPRGKSNLSELERDGYHNRILLCPNHHTEIDKDEDYYSIERLHFIKQGHELWVQGRLSEGADVNKQTEERIYSVLVDAAVENCFFTDWNAWVPAARNGGFARWPKSILDGIVRFHDRVILIPWPGTRSELEQSLRTLAVALFNARAVFLQHAEYECQQEMFLGIAFHDRGQHQQVRYKRLLREFLNWCAEYVFWLEVATKAANWLSDVVRREMNPMFFVEEGRFVSDLIRSAGGEKIPEFNLSEKQTLPEGIKKLHGRFMRKVRKQHMLV